MTYEGRKIRFHAIFHKRNSWIDRGRRFCYSGNSKTFCIDGILMEEDGLSMPKEKCGDNMRAKFVRMTAMTGALLFILAIVSVALVYNGVILLNCPSEEEYPIRGVDVSSYQGDIDWPVLSSQNVDFAFIKATEGSSFVDPCFTYNYSEAQKCNISVGAYHFFSYDSKGLSQAKNFMDTVAPFEGMLPPVIDLEFYGDKEKNPPSREEVGRELKEMLAALEEHYGQAPIIYATEKSYELYLSGAYEEYDIWIRNVISAPNLSDGREWAFWQFTNREKLCGYNGQEKYIDGNVFHGSREEFLSYPRFCSKACEGSNP